jgi:hypothetical protein
MASHILMISLGLFVVGSVGALPVTVAPLKIHPTFVLHETRSRLLAGPHGAYEEVSVTYNSQPLPLAPGQANYIFPSSPILGTAGTCFTDGSPLQVVFTDPNETPLAFPTEGMYAITGFKGEIVDANNQSVPLSTVRHSDMSRFPAPTQHRTIFVDWSL